MDFRKPVSLECIERIKSQQDPFLIYSQFVTFRIPSGTFNVDDVKELKRFCGTSLTDDWFTHTVPTFSWGTSWYGTPIRQRTVTFVVAVKSPKDAVLLRVRFGGLVPISNVCLIKDEIV